LALAVGLGLMGCKREEAADTGEAKGIIPQGDSMLADPSSIANQLGFAAHLPAETEGYFGTLNLTTHLAGLKDSNWAKEVDAFLDDKTPAPSAAKADGPPAASAMLASLWGQDFFVALGKGTAESLKPWQAVSAINTELQYLTMMQGTVGSAATGTKAEQWIAKLLGNTALLKRAADLVSTLSLPPVLLGVKTDKPDEMLGQLVPTALLEQAKTKAKVSQVTSVSGKFMMVEGTFAALLTDEVEKALLDSLPAEQAEVRSVAATALDAVQAKPFCLAYGTAHGHLIVALGAGRPNLDFSADATSSLLSRPELSFVTPYVSKSLLAITFLEAGVLEAGQNPEPLQPMVRGVLAGLKSSPTFGSLAAALEPKVQDLGALERAVSQRKPTTAVGIAWWENGLRVELKGGPSPEGKEATKPLRFAPLLDDPSVLLGLVYHGDPARNAKVRALVEAWAALLHSSAQELVKTGLGGKDGPAIAAWGEKDVVPPLVSFYNGSKTLYQQGTGDEHAWLIDLGGKVPPLPLLPQKSGEAPPKMLRIAALDQVTNRELVAHNWAQMEQSLSQALRAFPQLGMTELPPAEPSNAPGGIRTYAYPIFPDADDLVPCASISDTMLMLGTSKAQQADLATRLLRDKPVTDLTTLRWRVNFPAVREAVKSFAIGAAADNLRPTMKWLSPLGNASGRLWIEAGNVRQTITIEVKDTVRYD